MERRRQTVPLGLWELHPNGTVRHYEPEIGECEFAAEEVIGKNFFELAPSDQTQELRNQVQRFILDSSPAHSFDLTLQVDKGSIRTRVLLARTRAAKSGATQAVLIHIRRADSLSREARDRRKMS